MAPQRCGLHGAPTDVQTLETGRGGTSACVSAVGTQAACNTQGCGGGRGSGFPCQSGGGQSQEGLGPAADMAVAPKITGSVEAAPVLGRA